jgi:hypothetical protein
VAASVFMASTTTIYKFSQYSQGSVASFSTQFNTDWSASLPGTTQALATSAAPTVAILIISGVVYTLNPTDWIGFNNGVWQVVPNSKMAGLLFTPTTN